MSQRETYNDFFGQDMAQLPRKYKIEICRHWESGYCALGPHCNFLHPLSIPQRSEYKLDASVQALDLGSMNCAITALTVNRHQTLSELLPFTRNPELYNLSHRLCVLIEKYSLDISPKKDLVKALELQLVSNWIFLTNKIESAGTATSGETLSILQKAAPHSKAQDVVNLYNLIKQTYSNCWQLSKRQWRSVDDLRIWHRTLFADTDEISSMWIGAFRDQGVFTMRPNGSKHHYLHSGMVTSALNKLVMMIHYASEKIDQLPRDATRLLNVFALAAYVSFHLAEIHPFYDGNGRISRFTAKYILDSVCPLPIPMFRNRESYIEELILGEGLGINAPLPLLILLLKEGIRIYEDILKDYSSWSSHKIYSASSPESLEVLMNADGLPLTTKTKLLDSFLQMDAGGPIVNLTFESMTFTLDKTEELESSSSIDLNEL